MTAEEYLTEIERTARENFRPSDSSGSMTVARLGLLVRKVTGVEPEACGFPRFKDALLVLENRGALRTGLNDKRAFSFWLTDASGGSRSAECRQTLPVAVPPLPPHGASFRRLRSDVWLAFVAGTPVGRRFLNRTSGEVKSGQTGIPEPAQSWVELTPIDQEEDKADAIRFLEEEGLSGNVELEHALDGGGWFHLFAKSLQAIDPSAAFRWKRRRSHRVTAVVEEWRSRNDLPSELIYEVPSTQRRALTTRGSKADANAESLDLRDLVLNILRGMPVEELLDLRVPIREVVAALRPDLLNR